jgi:hypothetical protein
LLDVLIFVVLARIPLIVRVVWSHVLTIAGSAPLPVRFAIVQMCFLAVQSTRVALPYSAMNAASGLDFAVYIVGVDRLELAVGVSVRRARHCTSVKHQQERMARVANKDCL